MILFWTSWIPERFCLNGLIGRRIYSSLAETWIQPEYRLGQLTSSGKQLGSLKSNSNVDIARINIPTGPFWSSVSPSYWTATVRIRTATLLWKNPYEIVQLSAGFTRTEWTTGLCIVRNLAAAFILRVSQSWFTVAKLTGAEYSLLVGLSLMGQCLMVQSTDRMNFYLSLELQSFCFIVLCSFDTTSLYSVEAAMKYFLLSAFASICLRFGTGLLYWSTGQTHLPSRSQFVSLLTESGALAIPVDIQTSQPSFQLGIWLVSLALLWKLAAAPFHMWAVDVYQGSLSSVTLLISTLPKLAILGFWMSQWTPLWHSTFGNLLVIFSASSLLIGAFGALSQTHLKRFLAFSSIGHMGFLLMPLCASVGAESALLVHFFIYAISSIAIWGLLMWPWFRHAQTSATPIYLSDLAILWKTHPVAAWTLALMMTSLAGLPPFAGFLGKLGIFWWSRNQGQYALLFVALASTLVSSVYYLRILRIMYLDTPKDWNSTNTLTPTSAYIIAFCSLMILSFLWYSSPIVLMTQWLSSGIVPMTM
jgi:NADH-quinone oxidoreductase subunit N